MGAARDLQSYFISVLALPGFNLPYGISCVLRIQMRVRYAVFQAEEWSVVAIPYFS